MRERAVVSPSGWAAVYEAHADRLVQLATFLVGPHAAVDLVQEAVARAVHATSWPAVAEPGAYLTRVLVNEAHRKSGRDWRRRQREERAAVAEPVEAYGVDTDVRAAVRELSAQQRAIIFWCYWEDLTIPDVARRLSVSEGTVRRQLARAKAKLRKVLDG